MMVRIVEWEDRFSSALAPLWRTVHARLSSGRTVSRVRVGPLDAAQRAAIADLLGAQRLPPEYADISLSQLEQAVHEVTGLGVREVVTRLVGPVGDRAGERKRAAEERTELWDWLAAHPVVTAQPALADWATAVRRGGLVDKSVARTKAELERVLRVLGELPAAGVPLPVFADAVLGETHALDDGRCANLVVKALAAIYDVEPPIDAPERRALWERAGIADDELSSTVLAAGLRPSGEDVVSTVLRVSADAGNAAALTLQQLRGVDALDAPPEVWVFENPSVLALALDRFGPDCPPMVCTSGWPSSAGILLLKRLKEAGAALYYHGDFDGEGLRIAANVVARTGAVPWRMTTADYLAAVADGPPVGRVTPVPWDLELAENLVSVGKTVPEERVARTLFEHIG